MEMPTVKKCAETIINRPADEIWARIGNFIEISWIPGSEEARATMNGDLRTVRRDAWDKIGFSLTQRLTNHDDAHYTYSYTLPAPVNFEKIVGRALIANAIDGTLKVTPLSEKQSHVTWELETEDFLIEGAFKEYQKALDTVKEQMEGQLA
jgi:Polyketide cyclase / dehydrase and lipid transport